MNKKNTNNQCYNISDKIIVEETPVEEQVSIWRMMGYFGILAIICVSSFLLAKYIVRSKIDGEKTPIDTSERL